MCSPLASGNWNNGTNAGVFIRNWNNNRSNDNNNFGFRASDYIAKTLTALIECTGNIGIYASCIMAKSALAGFLVPHGNVNHA